MKRNFEKSHEFGLLIFILMCIAVVVITLTSCSAPQKTWAQKEKELCTPEYNYYKIVWQDCKYVYCVLDEGKDSTFTKKDIRGIRYFDSTIYKIDSYLLIEKQYDN